MPFKEFDVPGLGKIRVYKRRGARSLRLSLPAGNVARVTVPSWTPYQTGLSFALSKRDWISAHAQPARGFLRHGQTVGKSHRLIFQPLATVNGIRTRVRTAEVVVSHSARYASTDGVVQTAAEQACCRALKSQAEQLFRPRLDALADRYGFVFRDMRIKRMKSRWGSCDQHGNIVLNSFLVQLPWELIDYVMVHELTHTVALNHGTAFWHRFEAAMPDARVRRKAMRTYRPILLVAPAAASVA